MPLIGTGRVSFLEARFRQTSGWATIHELGLARSSQGRLPIQSCREAA